MIEEHLLVALDINDKTQRNTQEAIELAQKLDAKVTVVHAVEYIPVYPYLPYDEEKVEEAFKKEVAEKFDVIKGLFSDAGVELNECIIQKGKAFKIICETADKIKATRIVIGVGPHYMMESFIGSTADKVIRQAHQAVFLLNPYKSFSGFGKILCGYDFTESSDKALKCSHRISKVINASLSVIHVIPENLSKMSSDTAELEENVKNKFSEKLKELGIEDSNLDLHIVKGKPVSEICSYIEKNEMELLIVGTRSQNTFSRLFIGSTTEKIMRMAPCNIMTTKKDVLS